VDERRHGCGTDGTDERWNGRGQRAQVRGKVKARDATWIGGHVRTQARVRARARAGMRARDEGEGQQGQGTMRAMDGTCTGRGAGEKTRAQVRARPQTRAHEGTSAWVCEKGRDRAGALNWQLAIHECRTSPRCESIHPLYRVSLHERCFRASLKGLQSFVTAVLVPEM